jgi:hypothetical protein
MKKQRLDTAHIQFQLPTNTVLSKGIIYIIHIYIYICISIIYTYTYIPHVSKGSIYNTICQTQYLESARLGMWPIRFILPGVSLLLGSLGVDADTFMFLSLLFVGVVGS